MIDTERDIWSQWLLRRRFGDDPKWGEAVLSNLQLVRDAVLSHTDLRNDETLLDVGCGDGLIGFGALSKVDGCHVIFSDISQDLLDRARQIATEMQVLGRCTFLRASAEDLSAIPNSSVDVVTTRSVLIFVDDKHRAFDEFFRVLKPGGRLSSFEPINRFAYPEPPGLFLGYDVTPVLALAQKLKHLYAGLQPVASDPMLNFDERDLATHAERVGFREVHLELKLDVGPPDANLTWQTVLTVPGNPKIPSLDDAMLEVLTADERRQFTAHLRPLVEARRGVKRAAVAYLWAIK